MKNVFLSIDNINDNKELLSLLNNDPEINIISAEQLASLKATVIVNGPLTELNNLLLTNWKLRNNIEEILFIGGSDRYGDVTPVAEKNIYADPKAAQSVFLSNIQMVVFPLNFTRNKTNKSIYPYYYIKDNSKFTVEPCGIFVETSGKYSKGMTVTDIYSDKQFEDQHCLMVLDCSL